MSNVSKDERALLVVVNFSTGGISQFFDDLYRWMDLNALGVVSLLMTRHYRHIDTLTGSDATSSNFLNQIISLAQDPQTKVVDVFLNLHSSEDRKLHFDDGPITSSSLKSQLQAANLKHRLRLLYSTACFGAEHAPDFVEAGFRVASGAKGVNTNQFFDYPTQLDYWGRNETYLEAVTAGNKSDVRIIQDLLANIFFAGTPFFDEVDSEKIIEGEELTRITDQAI